MLARIVMLFGTKVETDQSLCTNEISKGKASLGRIRVRLENATKMLDNEVFGEMKHSTIDHQRAARLIKHWHFYFVFSCFISKSDD